MSSHNVNFYADHHNKPKLISLHQKVFNSGMDLEFWNWKYPYYLKANSPYAVVGGEVIAYYGVIPRNYINSGVVYKAFQAADVMVDEDYRGKLSSGMFMRLIENGDVIKQKCVFYGFPHKRHYILGRRLKMYELVQELNVFSLKSSEVKVDGRFSYTKSEVSDISLEDYNFRYSNFSASAPGGFLERGYSYYLYRYGNHPVFDYKAFIDSDSLFVVRIDDESVQIMDYLGDFAVFPEKIRRLSGAQELQGSVLTGWTALNPEDFLRFSEIQVSPAGAFFVKSEFEGAQMDCDKFWVSMGDTDFL